MSAVLETQHLKPNATLAPPHGGESFLVRAMRFASSVRVGVILLVALGAACMAGMLIMQQNVEGFANYFATLTPAQRMVYGKLGLFDVYHVWWFNALLAALSLNIVLSTIDRLPKVWRYYAKPSVTVPTRWLRDQPHSASFAVVGETEAIVERVTSAIKAQGYRSAKITEKNGRKFIFAETGKWNRLMFVPVHIGLLMIFVGGFMTAQLGNTGNLPLAPGQSSDLIYDTAFKLDQVQEVTKQLPFEVTFTDIRQKLIRDDGSLSPANTIDWMTWFKIKDETGEHDAFVQMNRPFDYRGYRFFQSSFTPMARARTITIAAAPADGGEPQVITIPRNGSAELADGTKLIFRDFRGNYSMHRQDPNEDAGSYDNPAAILEVVPLEGVMQQAAALGPNAKEVPGAKKFVNGYSFKMTAFEKVGESHVLSVQRDPGANVVYGGFALLTLTLFGTFAFSHRRIWAAIEVGPQDTHEVILAGNANRNPNGFQERFQSLERSIVDSMKESN